MELNKLFTHVDLNAALKNKDFVTDGNLEAPSCTYYVSLLWGPRGTNNTLAMLNGRVAGQSGQWHQIITHPMTDSDGEVTVVVGKFLPCVRLEFDFTVYPLEDIPACALFIVNATTNIRQKFAPAEPKKELKKGVSWNGNATVQLP